ncbi:reverse transcriptase domain-containing protein [Tanacetum coccineum]|uniref:Reverse transcriptase domain-containing protein n=1 Tax=Tanacetum coccineum TaxID=301880 RepID=A0ABQ4ZSH7_9ASTR
MHTRASNSELVEPLPEPERTMNLRLRRRNRIVPFYQRNNPPQHLRVVYPPILGINYFRHFLVTLKNLNPMDDEPIDTENEVVRLIMFPLLLTGEAKTWLDELNEGTIKTWDELRTAFISRFFPPTLFDRLLREIRAFSQYENESLTDAWLYLKEMLRKCHVLNAAAGGIFLYKTLNQAYQLLEDKVLFKLDWAKNQKTKPSPKKTVAFAAEGNNNSNNNSNTEGLNELTQEVLNAAVGGIFLYKTLNQAYQLLEDKVLLKLDWAKNQKTKPSPKKTVAFAAEGNSNLRTVDSNQRNWHSAGMKTIYNTRQLFNLTL